MLTLHGFNWVLVEEFSLSCHNIETILSTIDAQKVNLNSVRLTRSQSRVWGLQRRRNLPVPYVLNPIRPIT